MNQTLDLTQPGGLYTYQDTLKFMQDAYQPSIDALVQLFGDKVIVQGCIVTGGNITDGFVVFNGELMPVLGGSVAAYVALQTTITPEQFADGVARDVYTVKQLLFTATSAGNTAWNLFKRLPYNSNTIYDALNTVKGLIQKVVNVESAVILSGCAVSSVTGTSSGTATISAGVVLMDGEIVNAPLRTAGAWPCYLKPDGTYVTSDPGGTRVKFDYETSQRYADVMRRFQHGSGQIVMSVSAADVALFDAGTGLGKWKWLGWKICGASRSRGLIGYDNRTSNPGGADSGAWDSSYNDIASYGGNNEKAIAKANLPAEGVGFRDWYYPEDDMGSATNYENLSGYNGAYGSGDSDSGNTHVLYKDKTTSNLGDGDPFDVRSAWAVMLFIERI